ncbi:TIGR03364 family FAD-dependent oxidoreductase [Ferrimonas aestuarii]|uniref:TIGR03364 family FAD-dependent oxidoreductase n=1 Tax=Ferrimonas aestuarii TaxID=2569539 RepID=A0A4U1BPU0_9GAMM|nr:TIGR03364 family FAD-dependent oxidoreductase [Ferrimonas aestuarii]TKB56633.1 TIGR03364 family FAD-dependent oxidoreductase [Ferrimonas aestuarii]
MKTDLVIIGGGIVGCFSAYHALRQGKRVTLIESGQHATGATVRNFGQVVPSGMALGIWSELAIRSVAIYEQLHQEWPLPIRQNGSYYVASDDAEMQLLTELGQHHSQMDYANFALTRQQLQQANPNLKSDYCVGGAYYPNEYSAESVQLSQRLLSYLEQHPNCQLKRGQLAIDITHSNNDVQVRCSSGFSIQAEDALICCGHFLNRLFPNQLQRKSVRIAKLQMLKTQPIPSVTLKGNLLTGLTIRRYESFASLPSFSQLSANEHQQRLQAHGIHILFKQSVDGSIIIGDSHHYDDANASDSLTYRDDAQVNRMIVEEAQRILDLPHWNIAETWSGFYCQDDANNVLLETLSPGIHALTAIGGKGMTTSAGLTERVIHQLYAAGELRTLAAQLAHSPIN